MTNKAESWGKIDLEEGEEAFHRTIGDLHIWLRRKDSEIWIGHEYVSSTGKKRSASRKPPKDLEWSRWAPKIPGEDVSLKPVFPDLPLVVHSDFPLKITPGSKIQIYTRIPVWLRISYGKQEQMIKELPTVKLSRTWFGTPMEGELCYWATTKARRSLANVEKKPHLVTCPIHITNKTEEELDFEKFCYRVERLKMFRVDNELWADETFIIYHGDQEISDISMSGKLPREMRGGELISAPRKPASTTLASRTFRKIFEDNFIFGR